MRLDLNKKLKLVQNNEIKEVERDLSSALAEILFSQTKGENALKLYHWSLKLSDGQAIDVDESDKSLLLNLIKQCDGILVGVRGQLIEQIEAIQE